MSRPKTIYSRNPVQYIKDPEDYHELADYHAQGYAGEGWYFWDETWAYAHGPFEGEQAATIACAKYAEKL